MFADSNPDYAITVRDYGLLVTLRKESPPDAPSIDRVLEAEFRGEEGKRSKDSEAMLEFPKHKPVDVSNKLGVGPPEMVALNRQIEQLEKRLEGRRVISRRSS